MAFFGFSAFARVNFQRKLGIMKAVKNVLFVTFILWLSVVSSQIVQDPIPENTTVNFDISSYDIEETVTEFPDYNGTAIEEVTEEAKTPAEGKEEESYSVEEQPDIVSFPDNHKNFTPSQYLGDQEFPPYYHHLNPYQQQYKNYFEQKQIYNRKPIKFETDSLNNFYVSSKPNSLDLGNEKNGEDSRIVHNSFPYAFEKEKPQEQTNWHKNTGQVLVHEQPVNEDAFRGHQETILPYYVFPHNYPHEEEKFYKNEFGHYDHHHVKKDEKDSPWKKVFHVLTALVPLGLLLATLTPNVISINSTTTAKTTRQRSEDSPSLRFREEDVMKLMKKYGVESLSDDQCEDKIICELAREGGKNLGGPIERGFWFLANQTPWDVAEKAGMNELFKAIKTGNCDAYKCHSKAKSSFGKKIMRRHKTAG